MALNVPETEKLIALDRVASELDWLQQEAIKTGSEKLVYLISKAADEARAMLGKALGP